MKPGFPPRRGPASAESPAAAQAALPPAAPGGALVIRAPAGVRLAVRIDGREAATLVAEGAPGGRAAAVLDLAPLLAPGAAARIEVGGAAATIRLGGWSGAARRQDAETVTGEAVDEATGPRAGLGVVALAGGEAAARAETDARGRFALELPAALREGPPRRVALVVEGSDFVLEGGLLTVGRARVAPPAVARAAARPMRLAIRTATPDATVAHEWGDHHFALSLARAFERRGWAAETLMRDADPAAAARADVTLCLRGRQDYAPAPGCINLLWLISHPDRLPVAECDAHDHVFVASDRYAATLARRTRAPVSVLHQAVDPDVFPEPTDRADAGTCLFVGNSRREWRRMVRWCVERDLPLALYGGRWEGLVPPQMLRGVHVPNTELHRLYADSAVVLNDHWDSMRDEGFLSNRLFDASAVAAPIVTDPVAGLAEVFGETIQTAANADELAALVRAALANPGAARARARAAQRLVLSAHTFDHRAESVISVVESIRARVQKL